MWASCLAVDYGKNVVLKFGVDKSMKVFSVDQGKFNLKYKYENVGLVNCARFIDDKLVYITGNAMKLGRWHTDQGAQSCFKEMVLN